MNVSKHLNKFLGVSAGVLTLALLFAPSNAEAGKGASFASIQNAINSNNPDTILAQLERAEKLPCAACIDLVMPLIDDDRREIRDVAAWWLSKRAVRVQVRDEMIGRLMTGDTIEARNAAEVLGRFMHPDALEALEIALHDEGLGAEARVAAADAVSSIGHYDGKGILEAALGSESGAVRAAAAENLRGIRGNVEGLALVDVLDDEDPEVIAAAALSLGTMQERAAVPELMDVADDDALPARSRMDACWALGQIGDGAAKQLLKDIAADDPNSLVRSAARTGYHKIIAQ
jgi:hypothetical protein